MEESELDLDHALKSCAIVRCVRRTLNSTPVRRSEWMRLADGLVGEIDDILEHTPDAFVPTEWRVMVAGVRVLLSQVTLLTIAQTGGDLVAERTRCDVLQGDLVRLLSLDSIPLTLGARSRRQVLVETGKCEFEPLREFLLSIPLPTIYRHASEPQFSPRYPDDTAEDVDDAAPPMLRVIVFLDQGPVASPQLLRSSLLYPLVFRIRGLTWPLQANRLRLDFLTTCPPSEFAVSEFSLSRPTRIERGEYEGELGGQIKFSSGQATLLDDLVFKVRAAFEMADGSFQEIPVIGHNVLRLRVVSEDRYPLMTGNRVLDRHIAELVTRLVSDCPKVREELNDLLDMLQSLTKLLAAFAQEAIFKGRSDVGEAEFQQHVVRSLRILLGQDVQEHPNQAGGITDIRYRGVIVELKVEKENGDRKEIARKYTGQSAQYAGVEARQVSVLFVLDLSTKEMPPGDIRNDVLLVDVATHGGDGESKEFPSKAFVFVTNGNMRSPSSYSR